MTSQKTEKKRISSKIFVALAALTLVSCCFLGTTFARYTTGTTSGSAGADIADWEIVVEDGSSGSATGEFLVVSPKMGAYSESVRVNTIAGSEAVITIRNMGQVSADVTVTIDTESYQYYVKNYTVNGGKVVIGDDGSYEWTEAVLEDGEYYYDQEGRQYQWDATNHCPLYYNGQNWVADTCWTGTANLSSIITPGTLSIDGADPADSKSYKATLATGGEIKLNITGAKWTSDFTSETNIGTVGDKRDTWIGENVLKVGYSFSWEAVQSSEQP